MRVHDAVQVCLQHVQSLDGSASKDFSDKTPKRHLSFLQNLWKQEGDPNMEPLLPQSQP